MSDKPKEILRWQQEGGDPLYEEDDGEFVLFVDHVAEVDQLRRDLKAAQDEVELLSYRGPSEHVAHIRELRNKLAAANEKLENLEGKTAKPAEGGHRPKQ